MGGVKKGATPEAPGGNKTEPLKGAAESLIVSDGSDTDLDGGGDGDQWLRSAKNLKWAQKLVFITQSYTGKPYLKNPKDRKDFARTSNIAAKKVLGSVVLGGIAVFREAHQNGKKHFHAAVLAETKTMAWANLQDELLRMGVATDVRYVNAGPGSNPLNRVLKYVMVPSPSKLVDDKNPYATKNFPWPKGIEDEAAKAEKQLWSKPATADEVFHYLKSNLDISNYEKLNLYLEPRIARKTDIQVRGAKLSQTAASPVSASFCGRVASSFLSTLRPPIRRRAGFAGPTLCVAKNSVCE